MKKVLVIGGGAAGMMAAIAAAEDGNQVTILEKNEKLGKKLFITGKGRCNVTTSCEPQDFFRGVMRNPKFLYSSFYSFTNSDVTEMLEGLGLRLKEERGNRIFPQSDKSSDVIRTFSRRIDALGIRVMLHTEVSRLVIRDGICCGVFLNSGRMIEADAVIVATGGLSYPVTGSDGDGLRFAREAGLAVTETFPSLVPFNVKETWCKDLTGLGLKNVTFTVRAGQKELYSGFGEMVFMAFGVSGPLVLTASTVLAGRKEKEWQAEIDLKPAITDEQLRNRLDRELEEAGKKAFHNSLNAMFPARLIPVLVKLSGINPEKKAEELTAAERENFCNLIRHVKLTITGTRDFPEAIITRGGVSTKEIDPGTMESKKVRNLFFAGEVIDVDAVTGGYNLQIAWSTGHAAGLGINEAERKRERS